MPTRRDEFFGPRDPAAFATITAAREFAAAGATVGQAVIVVAPRDPVGIDQMIRGLHHRIMSRARRQRPDPAIDRHIMAHLAQKPLQDPNGIGTCIHIHVENAGLKGRWQPPDPGTGKIMLDKNRDRLRAREQLHIAGIDITVAV